MATTRAGRPAGKIRWRSLTRQWRQRPDVASRLKAHPSRDTGNACVWCGSWGVPSPPCTTAMPPSEPSRTRTGRRNEEMPRSWCIRPEITEGFRRRIKWTASSTGELKGTLPYSKSVSVRWESGHWKRWWRGRSWWGWLSVPTECTCSRNGPKTTEDMNENTICPLQQRPTRQCQTSANMFWGALVGDGPHRLIHMEGTW